MEDKNKNKIEEQVQSPKKRFAFKVNFSNALLVLVGVAVLSVFIYGLITGSIGGTGDTSLPNQLNNQLTNSTTPSKEIVNSGSGYVVYKVDGQFVLEIDDGSKVKDINALLKNLDLPSTTEVINPAAAYPRPITTVPTTDPQEDSNFDPINPNQPAPAATNANE